MYLLDHTHTHTGAWKLSEGIVFEHFQSEQYCAKEIECVSRACIYGREGAIGKKNKRRMRERNRKREIRLKRNF